jgi:hypothetical protein
MWTNIDSPQPFHRAALTRQKEVNPFFVDFEIKSDLVLETGYLSYKSIRVVEFDLVAEIHHVSKEVKAKGSKSTRLKINIQ